jgi:thiamine biosynthesis lipoprotein
MPAESGNRHTQVTACNKRGYPRRDALLFCLLASLALVLVLLAGCSPKLKKYSHSFTGSFDTIIQIIAYTPSERVFDQLTAQAEHRFLELHQLYDIYNEYPGLNNLCTVNRLAGQEAVPVDPQIIELVEYCLALDELAPGVVNITLGPVLTIWHTFRAEAMAGQTVNIPDEAALRRAAGLADPTRIVIDKQAGTLFLADAGMSLDVGAVAKGFATEIIARELAASGLTSGIISAGGSNVRLIGQPGDGRATWQIGLQNPFGNILVPDDPPLDVLLVNDQSIVTSGDYQRTVTVDGQVYHHLIDSETLQPAHLFRAVTIMTPDSALADYLSTAVFLMSYEEGRALVESLPDCAGLWVLPDGQVLTTPGMSEHLKSNQPAGQP